MAAKDRLTGEQSVMLPATTADPITREAYTLSVNRRDTILFFVRKGIQHVKKLTKAITEIVFFGRPTRLGLGWGHLRKTGGSLNKSRKNNNSDNMFYLYAV